MWLRGIAAPRLGAGPTDGHTRASTANGITAWHGSQALLGQPIAQ